MRSSAFLGELFGDVAGKNPLAPGLFLGELGMPPLVEADGDSGADTLFVPASCLNDMALLLLSCLSNPPATSFGSFLGLVATASLLLSCLSPSIFIRAARGFSFRSATFSFTSSSGSFLALRSSFSFDGTGGARLLSIDIKAARGFSFTSSFFSSSSFSCSLSSGSSSSVGGGPDATSASGSGPANGSANCFRLPARSNLPFSFCADFCGVIPTISVS